MSPIMVGGDGSVIWKVNVLRAVHTFSEPNYLGDPKDYYHEGISESSPDEMLKVTIRLPAGEPVPRVEGSSFLEAGEVEGRAVVTIWLPIESNNGSRGKNELNPDQIVIDWVRRTASALR